MIQFPDPLEIIVTGRAGQGAVTAGRLIAEAATFHGKCASQTAKTPVAVRDGVAAAHVILSHCPVDFPFVEIPYILVALDDSALLELRHRVQRGGIILGFTEVDSVWICRDETVTTVRLPVSASGIAKGDENLALVGALAALCSDLPIACVLRAMRHMPGFSEASELSLLTGESLVFQAQSG